MLRRFFIRLSLLLSHYWFFCGVDTSDGVEMTFETENGNQTYHYEFVTLEQVTRYANDANNETWVHYDIDLDNSVGIFTLRGCIDNKEYQDTLDSFFAEVFENDLENVVLDLRGNGGGNSRVANKFLQYLDVKTYHSWDSAIRYGWLLKQNKMLSSKTTSSLRHSAETYMSLLILSHTAQQWISPC